jgi:hypothetical protein
MREKMPGEGLGECPDTAFYAVFSSVFYGLLISQEKSINRSRNCLTVPKTANIMPQGSRSPLPATRFAGQACSSAAEADRIVFETLVGACGAGKTEQVKTEVESPAIAFKEGSAAIVSSVSFVNSRQPTRGVLFAMGSLASRVNVDSGPRAITQRSCVQQL